VEKCHHWQGRRSSHHFSEGREALKAVGAQDGPWNWVLLRPEPPALPLVGGGVGSLDEMVECLGQHDQEVLTGVLRMSFGSGRLRRVKHLLVVAIGARTPTVTRGRLGPARAKVEKALAEFVHISCALEVTGIKDLTLEAVIEKVRMACRIDDEVLSHDNPGRKMWTADAFRQALLEERRKVVAEARLARLSKLPIREAVELVHSDENLNWALFGLRDGRELL